ncbi:MAG: phenylacetate-CoA oxygenase subunit PaaJ [Actinomycetota bacterium]|nr:phenylacetate-CoA oxygenase subunit PaaJ [Actinomycetota bacterium]
MTRPATTRTSAVVVDAALREIPDPEVPVVSIADLGILREVLLDEQSGEARVTITPTYSGCPAMDVIRRHVEHVCRQQGWHPVVSLRLSPPWTTDWMTDRGRQRLREFGIAPPGAAGHGDDGPVGLTLRQRVVTCPQCGSDDTEELAHFGSTACKALRRCRVCREPFDEFKAI